MTSSYLQGTDPDALVTVVLPAYNHAKYVVEAIESVRAQTFPRWQLIVIDDGSTDDTWAILQAHAKQIDDLRIQLFTQTNAGSHATLNRGMAMAKTPYLAILNSDDRYAPTRLERLVEKAQSSNNEVFIVTGLRLIDGDGQPLPDVHWWNAMHHDTLRRWRTAKTTAENPAMESLLWGNMTVSTSNFFMSLALWQRLGPFKRLCYVPDWDYALRVARECPKAFQFLDDEALLDYRLHGNNTILSGALRNHAEAYHMLRSYHKKCAAAGYPLPEHAIDRLHYLARFIRHENTRQYAERQKIGWLEQVEALRSELESVRTENEIVSNLVSNQQTEIEQLEYKRQTEIQQLEFQIQQMKSSRSWQISAPLRAAGQVLRIARSKARAALRRLPVRRLLSQQGSTTTDYDQWLLAEQAALQRMRVGADEWLQSLAQRPLISIVMPVHNTDPAFLKSAIDSVRLQWYDHWEICICDDGSSRSDTRQVLEELQNEIGEIRLVRRETAGHIVQATNDAIALAQGEFVVFLDHDDELAPQALLRLVQTINTPSAPDLIYSDEDKRDEQGRRCLPLFKPKWSPALQWSQNYVGHIMCVRRTVLQRVGGLLEGSQGSQDHDLVLRLAAQGAKIEHIPEVLYHWRMHAASTSVSPQSKPYAHEAGKQAVARHLKDRYGEQFDRVDDSAYTFVYQPRFRVPLNTLVSIVIPTRDKATLLDACIQSIHRHTAGIAYEILVLDNGSTEPETQACFQRLIQDKRVRVVEAHIPFNWSRLNNIGRRHAKGQVLVFLNNDTEVITPDWLLRLSEYALLPDVATVGPLLLYPDRTIQHAGVVVGMGGWADHVFKNESVQHYPTPFISSAVPRNVLASTGACMAIATERFDTLGGFDEAFEICGSDVELGIRGHKQGLLNVYLPTAQLFHLESKTRTPFVPEVDFQQSALKYAPYRLSGDPFFNPNLDLASTRPRPCYPSAPSSVAP
jgi:glycosyltransferase involved in cell wall biosynthesis